MDSALLLQGFFSLARFATVLVVLYLGVKYFLKDVKPWFDASKEERGDFPGSKGALVAVLAILAAGFWNFEPSFRSVPGPSDALYERAIDDTVERASNAPEVKPVDAETLDERIRRKADETEADRQRTLERFGRLEPKPEETTTKQDDEG